MKQWNSFQPFIVSTPPQRFYLSFKNIWDRELILIYKNEL